MNQPPRFYVYCLIDPRNGRVFYVGKGQGFRAWAHEKAVKAGKTSNKVKSKVISEILGAGLSVGVTIVSRHSCELEAYKAEEQQIAHIGLDKLTNCNRGGHGSFSDRRYPTMLADLKVCADAMKLLHSMGDASDWIAARNYSVEAGMLWYGRLTEALRKIAGAVVDKHGEATIKEYLNSYVCKAHG